MNVSSQNDRLIYITLDVKEALELRSLLYAAGLDWGDLPAWVEVLREQLTREIEA